MDATIGTNKNKFKNHFSLIQREIYSVVGVSAFIYKHYTLVDKMVSIGVL